jgi:hypothetical protein
MIEENAKRVEQHLQRAINGTTASLQSDAIAL